MHPTSLPGPFGIGDFGPAAYRFADFLLSAGQRVWQMLPLVPVGYANSPYDSLSCFAGNPLLISPEMLVEDGLVSAEAVEDHPVFSDASVDYEIVRPWKAGLVRRAYETFEREHGGESNGDFGAFCREEAGWLDDYALFAALRESHDEKSWTEWEPALVARQADALESARKEHAERIAVAKFAQYLFFKQWRRLRKYCNDCGIRIVGDIPIYVSHNSVDVWVNRGLFQLDGEGRPIVVSGVPPDAFSDTGQRWGTPIYNWNRLAETGYAWWIERVKATLKLFDIVRLDHFRGFEGYWEVPASEATAVNGRWVPGPREELFDAIAAALGDLPFIAENLGVITPEVEALRKRYHMPGMTVLQFGMGRDAGSSSFPPHTYETDLVVYTGTHDNETLMGWWEGLDTDQDKRDKRDYLARYFSCTGAEFNWSCIRALLASVAALIVFPLQDVLGLGNEGRMNRPGVPGGNWGWRCPLASFSPEVSLRLRELSETYGRLL